MTAESRKLASHVTSALGSGTEKQEASLVINEAPVPVALCRPLYRLTSHSPLLARYFLLIGNQMEEVLSLAF